jgi:hypothetical protein
LGIGYGYSGIKSHIGLAPDVGVYAGGGSISGGNDGNRRHGYACPENKDEKSFGQMFYYFHTEEITNILTIPAKGIIDDTDSNTRQRVLGQNSQIASKKLQDSVYCFSVVYVRGFLYQLLLDRKFSFKNIPANAPFSDGARRTLQ